MRLKHTFLAFLAIFALLYSTLSLTGCDLSNGDDNNNNNGDDYKIIVEPLIKTQWHQRNPYNNLFPIAGNDREKYDEDGRPLTNCIITAGAQIMAFHRYPERGVGQSTLLVPQNITVPTVNLDFPYDWTNMLNTYTSSATEQQRNAVATLMYHISAAHGINGRTSVVYTANFKYDKGIQVHYRTYYNDAQWEEIIRKQLDAGLPVEYSGRTSDGSDGHQFIIDGYDNTGKFHVNWGFGDQKDGYFSLNALKPIGGTEWHYNNYMIINIKPDEGGHGNNEMAIWEFTPSKTSVTQNNELLTVTVQMVGVGFFDGGQAGVALVNNSGSIVKVIGTINYNAISPGSSRTSTINSFVPESVNPGQYNLRIVTKPEGKEWEIVQKSTIRDGVPNAIPITVTTGVANSGGYGMALMDFTPEKTSVLQNETFNIAVRARNISLDTFTGGQLGAALIDNSGNIVEVIGTINWGNLDPTYSRTSSVNNCKVTAALGQYKLRIVVRPNGGEWRIATMSLDGTPTSYDFTVQ